MLNQSKAETLLNLICDRLILELSDEEVPAATYKNAIDFIKAVKIEVHPSPGSKVEQLEQTIRKDVPFPRPVG